jgi:hypothetical protein
MNSTGVAITYVVLPIEQSDASNNREVALALHQVPNSLLVALSVHQALRLS